MHVNSRAAAYLTILGVLGSWPAVAAIHTPVISEVTTNFSINQPTLTIDGNYFGTIAPHVTLSGLTLVVTTYATTAITALLPANIEAGSYMLVVTNNETTLTGSFDATIGAAGPQGPPGAMGPAGAQGPQGAAGA